MEVEIINKKNKLAPKLRFKGFVDNWNNKKLNDLAEINPSNKTLPEKFIYIDLESVVKGRLLKENEILKNGSPSRAQRYLKPNDILFQMVRPYQMNNLFFDRKGSYVASTGYAQIRTKENAKFIYQYLHLQKFIDAVIERCTGTSYPSINSSDLGNIQISLPSLPEQQKIASFLSAVDEKIQQLTHKKELLEQYKKGVMQQLFSGKLRFKDENGKAFPKWEEKRLGEVANIRSGLTKDQILSNKGLKITRIETISNGTINLDKVGFIENCDNIEDYKIRKGDILFSNINSVSHIGKTAIALSNLELYHGMNLLCLRCYKELHDLFLFYLLNTTEIRNHFKSVCNQAVSQASINQTQLSKTKIQIPNMKEQKSISTFIYSIDTRIGILNNQLTKTHTFKKGLLQQMFV